MAEVYSQPVATNYMYKPLTMHTLGLDYSVALHIIYHTPFYRSTSKLGWAGLGEEFNYITLCIQYMVWSWCGDSH